MAARSPARSMAGPDVVRSCAPISAATIVARVVLPRPGGPYSRMWSTGSDRCRAASIRIAEVLLDPLLARELVEAAGTDGGLERGLLGQDLGAPTRSMVMAAV